MNFGTAIATCFQKFTTFRGRAARSEYWNFVLFCLLASIIAAFLDQTIGSQSSDAGIVSTILSLILLLPSIAVTVRRLHDLDKSGWWYLLIFVPILGIIVMIYWTVQRGTLGDNRFGPDPLAFGGFTHDPNNPVAMG